MQICNISIEKLGYAKHLQCKSLPIIGKLHCTHSLLRMFFFHILWTQCYIPSQICFTKYILSSLWVVNKSCLKYQLDGKLTPLWHSQCVWQMYIAKLGTAKANILYSAYHVLQKIQSDAGCKCSSEYTMHKCIVQHMYVCLLVHRNRKFCITEQFDWHRTRITKKMLFSKYIC